MKITFLDGLLIFIIINLVLIYIYQLLEERCENIKDGICKYFPNKDNNTTNTSSNKNNAFSSNLNNNNNNEMNSLPNEMHHKNNKLRILANDKGPVVGFHQGFKKHVPELGWRDFYLRLNSGINSVRPLNPPTNNDGRTLSNTTSDANVDLPFTNIITKNYLDQLESTDNIYSMVDY